MNDDPTDFLIDPDLPNTMYLGTESSVFRSSDGGATWWPLASGFPIIKVTSVNLHRGARILRVATAGRGAWEGEHRFHGAPDFGIGTRQQAVNASSRHSAGNSHANYLSSRRDGDSNNYSRALSE